jgi:hypothetical protein
MCPLLVCSRLDIRMVQIRFASYKSECVSNQRVWSRTGSISWQNFVMRTQQAGSKSWQRYCWSLASDRCLPYWVHRQGEWVLRFGLFHCLALWLTILRCFETSVTTRLHSITSLKTWISVSITFCISPVFNYLELRIVVAEMCWKCSVCVLTWETVELFKCRSNKHFAVMLCAVLWFVIGIPRLCLVRYSVIRLPP